MNETDTQLVRLYLSTHDERHLEVLVQRNLPPVLSYLKTLTGNPDTAADIAQETFVKVWKNLKRFDQRKAFRTWLFTIAKRTAIDELRKRNALPFSAMVSDDGVEFAETLAGSEPSPLELADASRTEKLVAGAVGTLPATSARVVGLRLYGDMTFAQIAGLTGTPLHTVKSMYRRALPLLRRLLPIR